MAGLHQKMQKNIENLTDLITHITNYREEIDHSPWYRGQGDESWELLPGILREHNKHLSDEEKILRTFRQSAAMLIEQLPSDNFGWMFLMQHYGVPTRLLDWSESPLVGMYFAITEEPEKDGAFWILDPLKLNKEARINYLPSFEDEVLLNYASENMDANRRAPQLPLASIATRNNPRIQSQQGVFTIHQHDDTPIEKVGDNIATKYLIPKEAKSVIKKQITMLGFNKFQMFPELSSISEAIKDQ